MFPALLGVFGVGPGDIEKWSVRIGGWCMSPNLVFGQHPVLLAAEGRPMYDHWWHVECRNERRQGLAGLLTSKVSDCEVSISLVRLGQQQPVFQDRGRFVGSLDPYVYTFRPGAEPIYVPLFLDTDRLLHDWLHGGHIEPGTYVTGQAFIDHNHFHRLPTGRYKATVVLLKKCMVCPSVARVEIE
jgi:hypothetical protein